MIYAAMVSFAAEHDGYLPVPALVWESPANNGANVAWAMDAAYPNGGTVDFNTGTLWPYMPPTLTARQQAVICPADTADASIYNALNINRNFSYSFNSNIGHPSGQVSMELTAVAKPPSRILIYEENAPNDEWSLGGTGYADLPSGRHGSSRADQQGTSNNVWMTAGRGNYCFFDGHIESLSPAQIINDVQQNPGNSRYSPLTQ